MADTGTAPRPRILVVDDDPAIGSLLADALETEGYEPVTCTHPLDALSLSEREAFDLAFVDMQLPGMSGWLSFTQEMNSQLFAVALPKSGFP